MSIIDIVRWSGLAVCGVSALACIYMLIRNQWVFDNRIKILNRSHLEYSRLPSYDTMLNRFWVWDIEKFKGEGQ